MCVVHVDCRGEDSPSVAGQQSNFRSRRTDITAGVNRKERKEHRAGRNTPDFTEGNKGNEVGTGTGFLQEATEAADSDWRKPRFLASLPLFASVQSFRPLNSVFFAFPAVKSSASFPLFASVKIFPSTKN
jgi:hypothetical protein